jgi:hypothetical protein
MTVNFMCGKYTNKLQLGDLFRFNMNRGYANLNQITWDATDNTAQIQNVIQLDEYYNPMLMYIKNDTIIVDHRVSKSYKNQNFLIKKWKSIVTLNTEDGKVYYTLLQGKPPSFKDQYIVYNR